MLEETLCFLKVTHKGVFYGDNLYETYIPLWPSS